MLKDIGANYVIIGHSENRKKGENNKLINQKIKSAMKANLKVILCVGETFSEKKRGKTKSVLSNRLKWVSTKLKKNQIYLLLMNLFGQLEQEEYQN